MRARHAHKALRTKVHKARIAHVHHTVAHHHQGAHKAAHKKKAPHSHISYTSTSSRLNLE